MADRAGATHTVDRVRIRPGVGPRAATTGRRLARVAGQYLGPALDRALAGIDDDLIVEQLTVRFPADLDELDDEAVAMLWASLVRGSLERLRGTGSAPSVQASPELDGREPAESRAAAELDAAELVAVVGALQRWARDGTPPTPAELQLARVRAGLADRALAELPHPWRALARQLLHQATEGASATTPDAPAAPRRADAEPPAAADGLRPADVAAPGPPVTEPTGTQPRPPAAERPGPATYQEPAVLPPSQAGDPRVAASSWGGLVLLHYRLRPYLELAADSEPDLDPVAVRIAALAQLVDDASAAADPLTGLLAGRPEWATPSADQDPVAWRDPAAASGRADQLIRKFAGDLPGFADSSAGFVREQWVRRRALLIESPPVVRLTLERRPLDLVLDRLPYPIEALRLPWTPPLFVGWEKP